MPGGRDFKRRSSRKNGEEKTEQRSKIFHRAAWVFSARVPGEGRRIQIESAGERWTHTKISWGKNEEKKRVKGGAHIKLSAEGGRDN